MKTVIILLILNILMMFSFVGNTSEKTENEGNILLVKLLTKTV